MARGRVVYIKSNEPNWLLTSAIYHTRDTTEAIHKSYAPYVQRSTLGGWASGTDAVSTGSSGVLATSEVRSGGLNRLPSAALGERKLAGAFPKHRLFGQRTVAR